MNDYEARPSEESSTRNVYWWASLDRLRERRVSPACSTIEAAIRWAEFHAHDDEERHVWKREVTTSGMFTDEHVWPDQEPGVQRDHLTIITRNLADVLTGTKRRKDTPSTGDKGSGHVRRPDTTMDARTPMLRYEQVYNDDGTKKIEFGEDGWPIEQEGKR